mgnify:CR=1 FL=1
MILINEAYKEKLQDECEIQAHFTSSILSALGVKNMRPEKLYRRPAKVEQEEQEKLKALALIKKARAEKWLKK